MLFKSELISNLHDFSPWVLRERLGVKRYLGRYVFYISNTLRIPLRKPCPRGPAPLGWQ
ncbi:hypothetical protein U3516DRAFT_738627 [Neocallimastix sp. 'constans']